MLLLRTIILKLILTICSAFLTDVINLKVSKRDRNGVSTTPTVWLTENRPFNFNIESDAEIQYFGCSFDGISDKQQLFKTKIQDVYAPWNPINTTRTMKGQWNCVVYFEGHVNTEFGIKVEVDVNECDASPYPCVANAECINTPGSFICTCMPGYTGHGDHCQVIDKCLSNPCPDHETCHIEVTGYRCSAVDPCKPHPCHEKAICMDQKPGFTCECRTGFTGDGFSCSAVDPCQSSSCHAKARCSRVDYEPSGFNCECIEGYDGDGYRCKDMNECQHNPCHSKAVCVNTSPGYKCHCPQGFTGDGYSSCSVVNECKSNPCHAQEECVNTYPGFRCNCLPGYTRDDHNSCSDIDECRTHVCHGYRTCMNIPGSFYCECPQGYHENTKGSCEDINECELNISDCKKGERCWNTDRSYKCCPNDKILDKNGYCACPDYYINYDKLGCVYNQCLNTSCGLRANCYMINAKPQCECPNGTTGDPYEECATEVGPGLPSNRGVRESNGLDPTIDILLYVSKTDKSLKHFTTVDGLILDQIFTISVRRKDVDFTIREKQIINCYKKGNRAVIHLNKTEIKSAGSKYIAQGPKARASMNGNWVCLITTRTYYDVVKSKGPTKPSSIAIEFPVTINKAPVTELPTKSAFVPADGMIYIEFDNDIATAKYTTLLFNRPFTIVINDTSNDGRNITNIKCHYIGNEDEIFTENQNMIWNEQQRVYKAQEGEAKWKMHNKWKCTIIYYKIELDSQNYLKENYQPHHCDFYPEVKVKNSEYKKHSEVFVNDVIVPTTQEIQAKGTYKFSVGEIVKVTCIKTAAALMNMSYFDGNSYVIETKISSNVFQTMYLKVGDRLNKHVLCNVQVNAFLNHDVQSIRLDFIKKISPNDLPTFNVNGLILAPTLTDNGNYYKLFYEYFEGEFINFTVSNGQRWRTNNELEVAELNGDKLIYSDYAQKKTIIFKSDDGNKSNIFFHLKPALKHFNVAISGLSFSQTNMKYLYNSTTYRTVFFNKNNKILNLTCSPPVHKKCTWDQNLSTMNNSKDASIKNVTFLPQDHPSQSTVLKCMCVQDILFGRSLKQSDEKEVHEVTILRDIDIKPNSERPEGKEEKDKSDGVPENSGNLSAMRNSNGNTSGKTLMLVAIIVVALIVVAAVLWLMVGLYKRRQRREKAMQSEFNYESLENTTERTMPTPAQWDNYSVPVDRQNENDTDTYSVPYQEKNVEDMYTKPQPKALRKPPNESLYAEPSYATVEQLGDKLTYGNLSNQTAEYSQIQPKKLIGNPNAPKVLPTETPYAQVLPKSMRPNTETSKYANVFDNQRYVNSDKVESSSEYAEPAYCEIGFKK